ncbi:hypothetical protein MBLNU459_g8375t1 [Dothideomycetes sp. NU459]
MPPANVHKTTAIAPATIAPRPSPAPALSTPRPAPLDFVATAALLLADSVAAAVVDAWDAALLPLLAAELVLLAAAAEAEDSAEDSDEDAPEARVLPLLMLVVAADEVMLPAAAAAPEVADADAVDAPLVEAQVAAVGSLVASRRNAASQTGDESSVATDALHVQAPTTAKVGSDASARASRQTWDACGGRDGDKSRKGRQDGGSTHVLGPTILQDQQQKNTRGPGELNQRVPGLERL